MRVMNINARIFEIISNIPEGHFVFVENIATGESNWSKDAADFFGFTNTRISNTKDVMQGIAHPEDKER